MSYPIPNLSRVWVRGRIIDLGKAATEQTKYGVGQSVTFSPSPKVLINATTKQIISSSSFKVAVSESNGYFQILLPATNDPDVNPTNFTYAVSEPGTGRSYNITVPINTPALNSPGDPLDGQPVIELSDIQPAPGASAGLVQLVSGRGLDSIDIVSGDWVATYSDGGTQVIGEAPTGGGGVSNLSDLDDLDTTGVEVGSDYALRVLTDSPRTYEMSPVGSGVEPTYTLPVIREVVSDSAPDTDTDGFTLTTSSAVQAGDTLLLVHGNDWNFDTNMHAPGGTVGAWDLVENAAGGVNVPHLKAWRAVAATGGVKTVTVAQASIGSDSYFGTLFVFVGDVVAELGDTTRGATGPSQGAPSLAGGPGRMLLCAFQTGYDGTGDTSYTGVPSGMTSRSNRHNGTLSGGTGAMLTATQAITATGATGVKTATYSDARQWAAMSLLLTQRTDPIGDALAGAASVEDLTGSMALGSISVTTTYLLSVAMTDMRVSAFAIAAAPITASDTNYWTVQLVRFRQGVRADLAQRTTRVAAPNGGVASGTAWTMDLIAFDPDNQRLRKDDVLAAVFTPAGTPDPWVSAICTWRYEPGIVA